jgi:hypothetical protein
MGTSGKWRTGGQVQALAHSQRLQYGQQGYLRESQSFGSHANNIKPHNRPGRTDTPAGNVGSSRKGRKRG